MADHPTYLDVLRNLLLLEKVATLATTDREGHLQVSMVPFAMDSHAGDMIVHVSTLASHTTNLQSHSVAAVLVMQADQLNTNVHALPRVSIQVESRFVERHTALYELTKSLYLAKFADMAFMTEFADFSFVRLTPHTVRLVSGFGAAKTLQLEQWQQAMAQAC
ncbi:pyridoxamine 5'-phosphate oxidase family protein [Rhodoferax sp.]|uniref:pyridoxamine 5'-phosphate oxidase family protein n=1 Tax=Rhodoferax sp. TaxID=50421 RepID=UPI0025FB4610|nr:pyridoxamine 5'-phosphate oxidase family protein [Rhodoferax sp.]